MMISDVMRAVMSVYSDGSVGAVDCVFPRSKQRPFAAPAQCLFPVYHESVTCYIAQESNMPVSQGGAEGNSLPRQQERLF